MRAASRSFVLFGMPNGRSESRIGLTVTRKIGGAVVRNRIKRMLRDLFRRNRTKLLPPLDLVVNVLPPCHGRAARELERELLSSFSRLAARIRR